MVGGYGAKGLAWRRLGWWVGEEGRQGHRSTREGFRGESGTTI
jgi:hypothetical protein